VFSAWWSRRSRRKVDSRAVARRGVIVFYSFLAPYWNTKVTVVGSRWAEPEELRIQSQQSLTLSGWCHWWDPQHTQRTFICVRRGCGCSIPFIDHLAIYSHIHFIMSMCVFNPRLSWLDFDKNAIKFPYIFSPHMVHWSADPFKSIFYYNALKKIQQNKGEKCVIEISIRHGNLSRKVSYFVLLLFGNEYLAHTCYITA
jgi:hypothetical protein